MPRSKQLDLPHVPFKGNKADMRAVIAHRLNGLEYRLAASRARRAKRRKPGVKPHAYQ
jgi:hypothetical protein